MLPAPGGQPQRAPTGQRARFALVDVVAFEDLPRRAQIHRMRNVALDVLDDYPIDPTRVTLLDHGHNTTFRIDTADGRRFALRINLNSRSTVANLDAETAWLTALDRDTEVNVPQPQPTRDGALHTARWCEAVGRQLRVVLMSWLSGSDLDPPNPTALHALGRVTAGLHDHAATWSLPEGGAFPSHATVLVGDPDRLSSDHPMLTSNVRAVVQAAMREAQVHLDALHTASRPHPLHADLHGGNVKWHRGRLAVFDFDDAVIGVPVIDLGVSAYYLRSGSIDEQPLLAGYASIRPLPDVDRAQFEALLAGRNLLLLNEMLGAVTAQFRAMQQRYVDNTVRKLAAYLETGIYRHGVPGVIPLEW